MKTVGKLTLTGDAWTLDVEPHVAMRLRRYFKKLTRSTGGKIKISATLENSRELRWWCDRWPLEMDEGTRAELDRRAEEHLQREMSVHQILAGRGPEFTFDLRLPPREYQRQAAAILLTTGRLLLADDLGLGKTVSGITTLADTRTLPALVVTMTHLQMQWAREIGRFAPNLKTHILRRGTPYPLTKGPRGRVESPPHVIITNYHKLAGWADALVRTYGVRSVIWDEAQELRRDDSKKWEAAKVIADAVAFRLGLTATPVYNYGGEFHNVLECIAPGALGTKGEFVAEWCTQATSRGDHAITDPKAFGAYVRSEGLMVRRTRADVGRELPPLTRIPHTVEVDLGALDQVGAATAELARTILRQGQLHKTEKLQAAEELSNKLRQATGVAKAPYVAEFVRMLVEGGDRVVLFGWHREVYSIWLDRLADLNPVLYTGSESAKQKDDARRRFVEGETDLIIISLRSGAGLDGLQGSARTVVFGELDWSPAVHDQAEGRVHRDGQTEAVFAYYLTADHGADPVILDVLGVKEQQAAGIRDPNGAIVQARAADEDRIRKLAASWLEQRGEKAPAAATAAPRGIVKLASAPAEKRTAGGRQIGLFVRPDREVAGG